MCLPSKVKGYTVQSFAVIVGNLLNLNFGLTFGVTPSHTKLYETTDNTPLRSAITPDQSTWVASNLFLSAAIASLVFGSISSKIGPKSVLLLSGLLQITGWFCVHFAYDIVHIYSSRIFAGIAAGAAFAVLPIYISEICDTASSKASLTVSLELWRALGIIIGFVFGSYVPYDYVPIVGILISFAFSMTFPFVQESPFYFLRKGNMVSFEKSLRWFRGIRSIDDRQNPEFEQELTQIRNSVNGKAQIIERDISMSQLLRLLTSNIVLAVGSQLSGVYVILHYGSVITTSAAPLKLPTDVCIMILAAVNLLGTFIGKCISGSANRKILLFITSLVSAICLLFAVVYLANGQSWDLDEEMQSWIVPLLCVVHVLCASIGFVSFSTTIFTENIPKKILYQVLSFLHLLTWLTVFILIQYFVPIVRKISETGILLTFSIGCAAVAVGSLFCDANKFNSKEKDLQIGGQSIPNGHFTNVHI